MSEEKTDRAPAWRTLALTVHLKPAEKAWLVRHHGSQEGAEAAAGFALEEHFMEPMRKAVAKEAAEADAAKKKARKAAEAERKRKREEKERAAAEAKAARIKKRADDKLRKARLAFEAAQAEAAMLDGGAAATIDAETSTKGD